MAQPESKTLMQEAKQLRRIAAKSKTKVGRHIANLMAAEKERQSALAKAREDALRPVSDGNSLRRRA